MKIVVDTATPEERGGALRCLSGSRETEVEIQEVATASEIDFRHLLVARRQGEIVGALLMMAITGEAVMVWPPATMGDPGEHATICDALMQEATARLDRLDATFAQVLVEANDAPLQKLLKTHGFQRISALQFMTRELDSRPPVRLDESWVMVHYDEATTHDEFVEAIEQTYIDSLDCPDLSGLRRGDEALASHRQSGQFDPEKWWLLKLDGEAAGLLLLNPHPELEAWELCYCGIVPKYRGRGLGRDLLNWGLAAACMSGAKRVFLAVDMANHYAKTIYEAAGFVGIDTREVWLRRSGGARGK